MKSDIEKDTLLAEYRLCQDAAALLETSVWQSSTITGLGTIGTVIVGAFDAIKAAEILEIPEGFCVVAMTPLGFPDPAYEVKATLRRELSEIVFQDKYAQ